MLLLLVLILLELGVMLLLAKFENHEYQTTPKCIVGLQFNLMVVLTSKH